jgi:hypothetical protein
LEIEIEVILLFHIELAKFRWPRVSSAKKAQVLNATNIVWQNFEIF